MKNSVSQNKPLIKSQETLDPEDWEEVRKLGHKMVDDMLENMATVRNRPAWQAMPTKFAEDFNEAVPLDGQNLAKVYETFQEKILPYPTGNAHPGFFGWVMGNGTATGMLADMLASGMNAHVAGYDQAASVVEKQVLMWLSELLGFPKNASGVLVSGGTMANLNGLAVARNEKADFDIREEGLQNGQTAALSVYGSVETHEWIYKACELMGLGRKAFRSIPVNGDYQIDITACREAIKKDIKAGFKPFCLIGTVGTVNTGAVDDIEELRNLADEFNLWLHIDGAFGSLAAFSPISKHLVEAQGKADSIAFDLHKWGYMPYEVGCILVKHPLAQKSTFGSSSSYLSSTKRGISVETTYFADRGLQLSRGFRALKVWMSFKEQGVSKIGRMIQRNIDQAKYLETLIQNHADLEILAPVSLNIVCFQFVQKGLSQDDLNNLNLEILLRIQESGTAVPSQTILDGKFAIRVCITNHRSETSDFDNLVDDVIRHGKEILTKIP